MKKLDFERKSIYKLTVAVKNIDEPISGPIKTDDFISYLNYTIRVLDVNDNSPKFSQNQYIVFFPEDYPIGSLIANVCAEDLDADSLIIYSLVGKVSSYLFKLNSSTGAVSLFNPLDKEQADSHNIFVLASDGQYTTIAEVVVYVSDVNDNNPEFQDSDFDISVSEETLVNQVILKVIAHDLDSGNNGALLYSIISGNNEKKFKLDSVTGNLTLASELDFEETQVYNLLLQVNDLGTPFARTGSHNLSVIIRVQDSNDNNPIFMQSSWTITLPEDFNLTTKVINLLVSDKDTYPQFNQLVYSIPDPQANEYFKIINGELFLKKQLQHNIINVFRFVVEASDGFSAIARHGITQIVIKVEDVNNMLPIFELMKPVLFSEGTLIGTVIGQIKAIDLDSVGTVRYFIENDIGEFIINEASGELITKIKFDSELKTKTNITIQAYDGIGMALVPLTVQVLIADINDNQPVFEKSYYVGSVRENLNIAVSIVKVFATDNDIDSVNNNLRFSILHENYNNPPSKLFNIDPATGVITQAKSLDREEKAVYTFTVVATDQAPEPLKGYTTVEVNVLDENDNGPVFDVTMYNISLKESNPINLPIVKFKASDADITKNTVFNILSGNSNNLFSIINDELYLIVPLDYETAITHVLIIEAEDSVVHLKSPQYATVWISVLDVNDNRPFFGINKTMFYINENSPVNTLVTKLFAYDNDRGEEPEKLSKEFFFFFLYDTNDFIIDNTTGEVRLVGVINYESQSMYTLVATVRDKGLPYLESNLLLVINVLDLNDNEPKFDKNYHELFISEKAPVNTSLITVIAKDIDSVNITYSSSTLGSLFSLSSNTGELLLKSSFNEDKNQTQYLVIITASDGTFNSQPVNVLIKVQDCNYNQPIFILNEKHVYISEYTLIGTNILELTVTDFIHNSSGMSYFLVDGEDSGNFSIEGCMLRTNENMDYEKIQKFSFQVEAINHASENKITGRMHIVVHIMDENDNSPLILNGNKTIYISLNEEMFIGSYIMTIFAKDNDNGLNGALKYIITSDFFSIDHQGQIRLAKHLYASNNSNIVVSVIVSDQGTPRHEDSMDINITVIPNQVQEIEFIGCPYTFSIDENTVPKAVLKKLTIKDTGIYLSTLVTYYVVAGDIANHFFVDEYGHIFVIGPSNYEEQNRFDFLVKASNERKAITYCLITVNVNDVNESPYFIEEFSKIQINISENELVGTFIFSINAEDPDINDTVTYSLLGSHPFDIDKIGRIKLIEPLDFEQTKDYSLLIIASDKNQVSVNLTVMVFVQDFNDNHPIFPSEVLNVEILENTRPLEFLTIPQPTDLDFSINKNIEFLGVYPEGILTIDKSGKLSVVGDLDYETQSTYEFTVVARDMGIPYLTGLQQLTLKILDVNDNKPVFDKQTYNFFISEKTNVGTIIASVHATDKDSFQFGEIGFYVIIGGNSSNQFNITGEGNIILNCKQSGPSIYILNVEAIDKGGQKSNVSAFVTIFVEKYLNNQPYFSLNTYGVVVNESVLPFQGLLVLNATSDTTYNHLIYRIISDGSDDGSFFTITINDKFQAVLRNKYLFDFEQKRSFLLLIEVSDSVHIHSRSQAQINVQITDVNDNFPKFSNDSLSSFNITENTLPGSTVAALYASDADDGTNKMFSFLSSSGDTDTFKVTPEGKVILLRTVDYDNDNILQLGVTVIDKGIPQLSSSIQLTFYISRSYASLVANDAVLPEDTPINSFITKVSAIDSIDINGNGFVYSLLGVESKEFFYINSVTGDIYLKKNFDYEVEHLHSVIVKAKGPTSSGVKEIIVNVTDVNDNPPKFLHTYYTLVVNEYAVLDQELARVYATDADSSEDNNNVIIYNFLQNTTKFKIDSNTGLITLKQAFDSERGDVNFFLQVSATDQGAGKLQSNPNAIVQVTILDVNDNFPVFNQSIYFGSVSKDAAIGTSVLQLFASDNDFSNQYKKILFSISQPFASERFSMNETSGIISTKSILRYESVNSYYFSVIATDGGEVPNIREADVEISIINIPDMVARFYPSIYAIFVLENTIVGTNLTQLHVSGSVTGLIFKVLSGNEDESFILGANGGLILKKQLDHEAKDFYNVSVILIDKFNNPVSNRAEIEINVIDINDNFPIFSSPTCYIIQVPESTNVGSYVLKVNAVDQDENYSIVSYAFHQGCQEFYINATTGEVFTNTTFDFEQQKSYNCIIKASDNGNPPFSSFSCLQMSVLDVNDEKPVFETHSYDIFIKEDSLVNSFVVCVVATDSDSLPFSQFEYVIINGNTNNQFSIEKNGFVILQQSLDYESIKFFSLEIEAKDKLSSFVSEQNVIVNITIGEVNDNTPIFQSGYYAVLINENTTVGTSILKIHAEDADDGVAEKTLQYISLENSGDFAIDEMSGVIMVQRPLDYETTSFYHLVAIVEDQGFPKLKSRALVDIFLKDVNDNPPVFVPLFYEVVVSVKAAINSQVVQVFAADRDFSSNEKILYSILSGNQNSLFKIESSTGLITTNSDLDSEVSNVFQLIVVANDSENASVNNAQVTITVQDVNDNQLMFATSEYNFEIAESVGPNAFVGTVGPAINSKISTINNNIKYYIIKSFYSNYFAINANGTIFTSVNTMFDYEMQKEYAFEVAASFEAGHDKLICTTLVQIRITDFNDNAPEPLNKIIALNVTETTVVGSLLTVITATDKDSGRNAELNFLMINETDTFIVDNNGNLLLRKQLDNSIHSNYELDIVVSDSGIPVLNVLIKVFIRVQPFKDSLLYFSKLCPIIFRILENEIKNSIGYVTAKDLGSYMTKNMRYDIESNISELSGLFFLNQTTGELNQVKMADYEVKNRYDVRVCASNEIGSKVCCIVSIIIEDVNEQPYFIDLNSFHQYSVSVSETAPSGSIIFMVVTDDPDSYITPNGQCFYEILPPYNNNFVIDQYGRVWLNTTLDREVKDVYVLTVRVSDKAKVPLISEIMLTVFVIDFNDNRPIIDVKDINIDENSFGKYVGQVTGFDLDGVNTNQQIVYDIQPEGLLLINNVTGNLTVGPLADYEKIQSYKLVVIAKDTGFPYLTTIKTIIVTINNLNDNDPYFPESNYHLSISDESEVGTLIISLCAKDDDLGSFGEIVSYKITAGNEDDKFKIDEQGRVTLQNHLKWSVKNYYVLEIKAFDCGLKSSSTANVFINITSYSREEPFFLSDTYIIRISEDKPVGSLILTINASSLVSSKDHLNYSIINQDQILFMIDSKSGEVYSLTTFDYELRSSYSLVIKVKDTSNKKTNYASLTILITDVNDNSPVFTSGTGIHNITEFTLVGSLITCLSATDEDENENGKVNFKVVGGDGINTFQVNSDGKVILIENLIYDKKSIYSLKVEANDNGINKLNSTAIITFFIQKAFSGYSFQEVNVKENVSLGTVVAIVFFNNLYTTVNEGIRYFLVGRPNKFFYINESNGIIKTTAELDRESNPIHILTIQSWGPTSTSLSEVVITVDDVNDNKPIFVPDSYQVQVLENIPLGYYIAHVRCNDKDAGENSNIVYSILEGDRNLFFINSTTGIITLFEKMLDHNTANKYVLKITAVDQGNPSLASVNNATVEILIQSLNNVCPQFTNKSFEVIVTEPGVINEELIQFQVSYKMNNISFICSIDEPLAVKYFNITTDCILAQRSSLYYDLVKEFHFVVKATNPINACLNTANVIVKVHKHPDEIPSFMQSIYQANISESTLVGAFVLHVAVIPTAIFLFTLTSANIANLQKFRINSNNGEIFVSGLLDYESQKKYEFQVIANDSFNLAFATIKINILDVNDNAPSFSQSNCYARSIPGSSAIGTSVILVSAFDIDNGDNGAIVYSIKNSSFCSTLLINSTTGLVTTSSYLDNGVQYCLIKAEDKGSPSLSGYTCLSLTIESINAPKFPNNHKNITIQENIPINSLVASVSVIDRTSSLLTYKIISGNKLKHFLINKDGDLIVVGEIDYESLTSYVLEIEAQSISHNVTLSSEPNIKVYIEVLDVNDNYPEFNLSYYKVSVNESAYIGQVILNLTVHYLDFFPKSNSFFFSALENTNDFKVDLITGAIFVVNMLDYETRNSYSLVISVQDQSESHMLGHALVDITVTDVNDNFPSFKYNTYNVVISEKTLIGTSILWISASDGDVKDNVNLIFNIENTTLGPKDYFVIDGNTIKLAKELDYKNYEERIFQLEINVTDQRGAPGLNTTLVVIEVINVRESVPIFDLDIYHVDVLENSNSLEAILELRATDKDNTAVNSSFVYSLTTRDADFFSIVTVSNGSGILFANQSFDYETKREYTFSVIATCKKGNNLIGRSMVIVRVSDVNDNKPSPDIGLMVINISDSTHLLSIISVVFATDPDQGLNGQLSYSVINPLSPFNVDNKGIIRLMSQLNASVQNFYNEAIKISDKGTPSLSSFVYIYVNIYKGKELGIKFTQPHYIFSIEEHTIKTFVGLITLENKGEYNSKIFTFKILSGDLVSGMFELSIQGFSAIISQVRAANFNTKSKYDFTVQANNEFDSFDITLVTIHIEDVNERPYFVGTTSPDAYEFMISDKIAVPSFIYTVIACDDDAGNNSEIEFKIINSFQSCNFTIDKYGRIEMLQQSDRKVTKTYHFQVQALDKGIPSLASVPANIFITILENDIPPTFYPPGPFQLTLVEGITPGSVIGKVFANTTNVEVNGIIKYDGIYPEEYLTVDLETGIITIKKTFDYEKGGFYNFLVVAYASENPYLRSLKKIEITLINQNDEAPFFKYVNFVISVSERTNPHTVILSVYAEDMDYGIEGDIAGYELVEVSTNAIRANESDNTFIINESGDIILEKILDFNKKGIYNYSIQAFDRGTPPMFSINNISLTIFVENKTLLLLQLDPYLVFVNENILLNSFIVSINTDRGKSNQSLAYSILSSEESKYFNISLDGVITNIKAFDYETIQTFLITIEVEDLNNGQKQSGNVTVHVKDINDNYPTVVSNFVIYISDQTLPGSVVGLLHATDFDSGKNGEIFFKRIDDDCNNVFTIESDGVIHLVSKLNSKTRSEYSMSVIVMDQGKSPLSTSILINVKVLSSQNDVSSLNFDYHYNQTCINENIITDNLMQVQATNSEGALGSKITYSLNGAEKDIIPFNINSSSGIISLLIALDYELKQEYNFLVNAVNDVGNRDVKLVSVCVYDVDDHDPIFEASQIKVNVSEVENVGYHVYQLYITDLDQIDINVTIMFEIVSGNNPELFQIDNNGLITLKEQPDLENLVSPTFDLQIRVVAGNKKIFTLIQVTITDWNDNNPIFILHGSLWYEFNISASAQVGDIVGFISALDLDISSPNNVLDYFIISTNNDFIIKTSHFGGANVCVNKPLNYNQHYRYEFLVLATDRGYLGLSGSAVVVINIFDVNNLSPEFKPSNYSISISEITKIGTKILRVYITNTDKFASGKILFNLIDITNTFIIDNLGHIVLNSLINYEVLKEYYLTVTARDVFNLSSSNNASVTIRIVEFNGSQPSFEKPYYTNNVFENVETGFVLLSVHASINDSNDTSYFIIPNLDSSSFKINSVTGEIRLVLPLDFEIKNQYTFSVQARDSKDYTKLTGLAHVMIIVEDINDNSPKFISNKEDHDITVLESTPIATILTVISAIDIDSGINGLVTYTIVDGNIGSKFNVDPTGKIRLMAKLDFNVQQKYILTVNAKDNGSPPTSTNDTVIISVLSYLNSAPILSPSFKDLYIEENGNFSVILKFEINSTSRLPITLSFHSSTTFSEFQLVGKNLVLASSLDYERQQQYSLIIIGSDEENNKNNIAQVNVHVQNINDNPPVFNQTVFQATISELSYIGHSVMSLNASDKDGDFMIYQMENSSSLFDLEGSIVRIKQKLEVGNYSFNVVVGDGIFQISHAKVIIIVVAVQLISFKQNIFNLVIYEDQPTNQVILTTTAGRSDDIVYSIEPAAVTLILNINKQGELYINSPSQLNFKETKQYIFQIKAHGLIPIPHSIFAIVVINVLKQNKYPPTFLGTPYNVDILESHLVGSTVLNLIATDVDENELSFSILSGAEDKFMINNITGAINLANSLINQNAPFFELIVQVTDSLFIVNSTVTINVLSTMKLPLTFSQTIYHTSVLENATVDVMLFNVTVNNAISTLNMSILEEKEQDLFSINAKGEISLKNQLDYEMQPQHIFTLVVQGTQGFGYAVAIVNVVDVNDCCPQFSKAEYIVYHTEPLLEGLLVAQLSVNDRDSNNRLTFAITGDKRFDINNDGEVVTLSKINNELQQDNSKYSLSIVVSDGNCNDTTIVTINVYKLLLSYYAFLQPIYMYFISEIQSSGIIVQFENVGGYNAVYSLEQNSSYVIVDATTGKSFF